jgi:hypothetical protein
VRISSNRHSIREQKDWEVFLSKRGKSSHLDVAIDDIQGIYLIPPTLEECVVQITDTTKRYMSTGTILKDGTLLTKYLPAKELINAVV